MFNVEGPWVWNIRNKGRDGRTVEKGMEYNGIELNKVNSKQVPILCQALHKGIWECMSIEDWDTGSIAKGVWSLVHHHQHSKLINAGREMLVQREILKGMSLKRLPGTSLVVQWLRLCFPMQNSWVQSLVGELRSHVPRDNEARAPQLESPCAATVECIRVPEPTNHN